MDFGAVLADNLSRMPVKTLGLAILDLVLDCMVISRQQIPMIVAKGDNTYSCV